MTRDAAKHGMPPVGARNARLLILGSLPGDVSIRQQQYYAHPQNQFWRILSAVFGAPFPADYRERLALLDQHNIAVWDVLQHAYRPGSLDSAISAPVANDFRTFFDIHPHIAAIAFNGQKAAALFKSCVTDAIVIARATDIAKVTLPSTSPAAATLRLDDKIAKWRAFLISEARDLNPEAHRPVLQAAARRSGSRGRR